MSEIRIIGGGLQNGLYPGLISAGGNAATNERKAKAIQPMLFETGRYAFKFALRAVRFDFTDSGDRRLMHRLSKALTTVGRAKIYRRASGDP
jgi:hypothetical protein